MAQAWGAARRLENVKMAMWEVPCCVEETSKRNLHKFVLVVWISTSGELLILKCLNMFATSKHTAYVRICLEYLVMILLQIKCEAYEPLLHCGETCHRCQTRRTRIQPRKPLDGGLAQKFVSPSHVPL